MQGKYPITLAWLIDITLLHPVLVQDTASCTLSYDPFPDLTLEATLLAPPPKRALLVGSFLLKEDQHSHALCFYGLATFVILQLYLFILHI